MNKDQVWNEVYNMDGRGLSDYLNHFTDTDDYKTTLYGEQVFTNERFSFSQWSKWRWECSYYFNGLFDAVEELGETFTDEEITDILVFGICRVLSLVGDAPNEPEDYSTFLFC